ncbi:hypothetical protein ACTWPT_27765 [Nonomuraea sp. 3N208]|uniref:hypothetical protein n=1 Tax=Nonomuraea sp. 3N208 TaxID=3457421 RepID=UPI003FD4D938
MSGLIKVAFFIMATASACTAAAVGGALTVWIGYLTAMPIATTVTAAATIGIAASGTTVSPC